MVMKSAEDGTYAAIMDILVLQSLSGNISEDYKVFGA